MGRILVFDLVTPVNEISGRSHLRSATLGHFAVPRTRTKLGSRAFSVAGPAAWNSLPASILRTVLNVNSRHIYFESHTNLLFNCFYVLLYCKVPLAELLCKRRHRSSMMMMMM